MLKKLTLLNETILNVLNEKNEIKIVKAFTDLGINILEADFGFVWFKESESHKWTLVYKTPNLPFSPKKPRITGLNHKVMKDRKIEYIKAFKNTPDTSEAGKHMKSFVVIPISFKDKSYGTIVLCFKKRQHFSREKKILGTFLGNGIAQIINSRQSREKIEKLKEASYHLLEEKAKVDFIANATHELRTPLAIIKGNVDLATLKEVKNKNYSEIFNAINHEVSHLADILSDLTLITSQRKNPQDSLLYTEVNLGLMVKKIADRFKIIANKKNISITTKHSKDITFWGDKMYLEKMLINLVKNSITYGNVGGKTTVEIEKSKKEICITVSDDGVGIPKEDLPHVFERFYRVDKSHSTDGSSTGLGLAIVKWVAEVHGGHVSVKSKEGKGSTFSIILPHKAE